MQAQANPWSVQVLQMRKVSSERLGHFVRESCDGLRTYYTMATKGINALYIVKQYTYSPCFMNSLYENSLYEVKASSSLIVSRDSFSPWTRARFHVGGA